VFIDESGVTFTPLVQKTWAPRGQTPVLTHRLRSWKKVSLVGVWSVSHRRRRVDWSCQLVPGRSLVTDDFIGLLRSLLRRWRGNLVLVWDRLPGHRSAAVRRFAACHPRLDIEYLPAYAPEFNPNEYAWGYLKRNMLPQFCPDGLHQLHVETWFQTLRLSGRDRLLRSFFNATQLPFRWPR
jgi:transposase